MKFKEWLAVNEINKGLARTFKQQHPHLPSYVANQVLQNRMAPLWQTTSATNSPTVPDVASSGNSRMSTSSSSVSSMFKAKSVSSIAGNKQWKMMVLDLHPTDFTEHTLDRLKGQQFGLSPVLANVVRNHQSRVDTQSKLSTERGSDNEPIILVRVDDKYEMQEGWHRLYAYLTQYSAPPEEQAKIKNDQMEQLDFSKWKRFKIKAWVGSSPVPNNQ